MAAERERPVRRPLPLGAHGNLTRLPPRVLAISTESAGFPCDAAASAAPDRARWDDPCACSKAVETTSRLRRLNPAEIAPTATDSALRTRPGWCARSGSWSTLGTLPKPAAA